MGVFEVGLFWYGQCTIIQKRTYAHPQKSYAKCTKIYPLSINKKPFYIF